MNNTTPIKANLPIVFYFPWEEPSGGPVFLTAIARNISREFCSRVYYTDYEPGLSDKMLEGSDVIKIRVSTVDFSIKMSEPVILVIPIYWADRIPQLHPESRILFINWHNLCIPVLQSTWGIGPEGLQTFLNLVYETNAVAYCDSAHRLAQEAFGVPTRPTYIPIGIKSSTDTKADHSGNPNQLRLAIIGRLSIDKVFSVTNLARLFDEYAFNGEKILYVIGDGPEQNLILKEDFSSVSLVMTGPIFGRDLEALLKDKIDAVFAMGTSVLASARLAIPSIVVCNEIHDYYDNMFVFLHHSSGGALGWQIHQIEELGLQWKSLCEILDELVDVERRVEIGKACLEYVEAQHSISGMVEAFEQAVVGSTLTYRKFGEAIRRPTRVGRVRGLKLGPLGRFETFRRTDGSRIIRNAKGSVLANIPRKGLKRLAWFALLASLALPFLPIIFILTLVNKIRRKYRRWHG